MIDRTRRALATRFLNPRWWLRKSAGVSREVDSRLFGIDFEQYHRELQRVVLDTACQSLLDVGCGERSPIHRFSMQLPLTVGLDVHAPSIERSREAGIHSEYRIAKIADLASEFAPKSFDCVVALDVLEHFSKEEGNRLLNAMESIAKKKVIVFTPNGLLYQPPAPANPFQEHLSGWTAEEMRERGFDVVGIAGWKPLRGPYVLPRWRPYWFWRRVSLLTERRFESRPEQAFQILCVKKIEPT